eukprot:s2135_g2.t1
MIEFLPNLKQSAYSWSNALSSAGTVWKRLHPEECPLCLDCFAPVTDADIGFLAINISINSVQKESLPAKAMPSDANPPTKKARAAETAPPTATPSAGSKSSDVDILSCDDKLLQLVLHCKHPEYGKEVVAAALEAARQVLLVKTAKKDSPSSDATMEEVAKAEQQRSQLVAEAANHAQLQAEMKLMEANEAEKVAAAAAENSSISYQKGLPVTDAPATDLDDVMTLGKTVSSHGSGVGAEKWIGKTRG